MRNICTINFNNYKLNGQLNSVDKTNTLILDVTPLLTQKEEIYIQVIGVNGVTRNYDYQPQIEVDNELFNGNGVMRVRVISTQGDTSYIDFDCVSFNDKDELCCKYNGSRFVFFNSTTGGGFNIDKVYPIGAVYISVVETSPSVLFGGAWERFANGRTLVGVSEGESEFNTVKKTGGAKTHTLTVTEMPSHTHTQNAHNHGASSGSDGSHTHGVSLSAASAGAHSHSVTVNSGGNHTHTYTGFIQCSVSSSATYTAIAHKRYAADGASTPASMNSTGSHSHSASSASAGAHTHSVSGNTGSAGSHAHTVSVNNTTATNNSTGGSGAHNNLQPYITVYMWVRTS